MVGRIEDTCHELGLVTPAEESRHVRLNHHFLLGHGLALNEPVVHVLRGGNAHEAPRGEALGQRELNGNAPLCVGGQSRIEEGRLVQVLAHLHSLAVVLWFIFAGNVFCHYVFLHHGTLLYCHRHGSHHHVVCSGATCTSRSGIAHHGIIIESISVITIPPIGHVQRTKAVKVEAAELHLLHLPWCPVELCAGPQASPRRGTPVSRWCGNIHIRRKAPVVPIELVERLVVHGGHELCVSRCAVRVGHGEPPLLLLTRRQSVAEGLPLQGQLLVGQRALNGSLVGIELTVLHPGKGEQQAVAILLLVGELTVPEGIALVEGPPLNDFIAGKDAIDGVHVSIAGAHLYGDRASVEGEVRRTGVEPVFGVGAGHGVVKGEDGEGLVER